MQSSTNSSSQTTPPSSWAKRLTLVGPGLIVAATGVGAGDLVAALVAGTKYGYTFVWAVILGAILKFSLNEGVGRWQLATGQTIFQGWRSLGKWTSAYFGIYSIIWGFIYGAAIMSSCALATSALFPQIDLWVWAILHGLVGFLLVWTGKYQLFEKVMTALVGIMFVTVVGTAVLVFPDVIHLFEGVVPSVPDGSLFYALGLVGGVGGSLTLASYGYWIREKNWVGPSWIPFIRFDSAIAYVVTGIFTLSLMIVGAEFLFGTGMTFEGEQGLVQLAGLLGDRFGEAARWLFLIGFWATSFTSLLGVWNGVPYLFADLVRHWNKDASYQDPEPISEKAPAYRAYLLWLTFPPMLLLFLDKPVSLVILYGVLGALFMPFLAFTLFWLLNSKRVDEKYRNRWLSNSILVINILLFAVLAVQEIIKTLSK
ncbi:Nramp family divalent metal transporter [Lihuaxuella thermophila]|uniref:Mn2+ and Fe2+ transporters of the NRAMP family n=1 Tax=Lihuaxuella thermophila TaxID=1173111 RepID=A0A1H8HLM0_9BACL|nr:Nramp family divalent metal transporter [Lihuaxuella thermophila]SEN57049.1 Mn2+ and Fe2+ transporters of the NRAMP family [Lihuaxuella thermophila]